ncbi:MAG: type II toxin-antitoxin system RelE/ParE family toxin [Tannerella sp.]|jgi:putative addiction module killer protein|nr:type II toxin-antitoxin system RelE/ParE family toxin [Tannerella sp.]
MNRKISSYGYYFDEFRKTLTDKELLKLKYSLDVLKTQEIIPRKFFGFIRDGLFELKMEYGGNIYRVFFVFENDNIVILFNGFQKKTQKTPPEQIKKALQIKKQYENERDNRTKIAVIP